MTAVSHITEPGESVEEIAWKALSEGPVQEFEYLGPAGYLSDSSDAVLVRRDIMAGEHLHARTAVVVLGSVLGSPGKTCKIKTEGNVAILGQVNECVIQAKEVCIGKGIGKCKIKVEHKLDIRGNSVDSEVNVTGRIRQKEKTKSLEKEVRQILEECAAIEQQLRMEQRRLYNLFKATGIDFNLTVGQIVTQSDGKLIIDLGPFYSVVGHKSDLEIDRALREFFAKAVIGLLTRLNRSYISEGKSKRQTFVKVIRKLQDLLYLTRCLDKKTKKGKKEMAMLDQIKEAFQLKEMMVRVVGSVSPEFDLTMSQPVQNLKENFDTNENTFTCTIRRCAKGKEREIRCSNNTGEEVEWKVDGSELRNLKFFICDGRIVWEKDGFSKLAL